jgi:hypothetical protein
MKINIPLKGIHICIDTILCGYHEWHNHHKTRNLPDIINKDVMKKTVNEELNKQELIMLVLDNMIESLLIIIKKYIYILVSWRI